jgi:hypothetical protein
MKAKRSTSGSTTIPKSAFSSTTNSANISQDVLLMVLDCAENDRLARSIVLPLYTH